MVRYKVGNLIMDLVIDKEEGMHGFGSPEFGEFIGMEGSIFTPSACILREYIARDCSSTADQMLILLKSQGESFCNDNVTSEVIKGLSRIVDWMGLSAERISNTWIPIIFILEHFACQYRAEVHCASRA